MPRGDSPTADAAASAAANNSSSLYSTLAPQLQTEAANPQGFGPTVKAQMNTAAQQSAGGGEAAAAGAGALNAARTRNAGSADAAIADAARTSGKNATNASLDTELADAQAKQHEQQAGLGGEQSLEETSAGDVAPDVKASTGQQEVSQDWYKYLINQGEKVAGSFI